MRCYITSRRRWSKEQKERAHQIVNDIAEGFDNGEGRVILREALAIYADLLSDATARLQLKELGEVSELCTQLKAVIARLRSTCCRGVQRQDVPIRRGGSAERPS